MKVILQCTDNQPSRLRYYFIFLIMSVDFEYKHMVSSTGSSLNTEPRFMARLTSLHFHIYIV